MIFLFKGKRRHKIKRGKERNSRLYYMDVRRLSDCRKSGSKAMAGYRRRNYLIKISAYILQIFYFIEFFVEFEIMLD